MIKISNIHFITIGLISILFSCHNSVRTDSNMYTISNQNHIEYRDSLYIIYTLSEWRDKNWQGFGTMLNFFEIENNQITFSIPAIFYSPDKKKLIAWYLQRYPNAKSKNISNGFTYVEPGGADTLYFASAIIGYRYNVNSIWSLYPLDYIEAQNYPTINGALSVLRQYYYTSMESEGSYKIEQSGIQKGYKKLQLYGYNIQDERFWNKCWIWDRDTVGSYGLFNFQIESYTYSGHKCTYDCANPYNPPSIDYPQKILELYK